MSLLVFHHLPKTGGTSFSSALDTAYGHNNYRWFHGPGDIWEELNNGTGYKAVGGHFHMNYPTALGFDGPYDVITIFRDPIARTISNYNFFKRNTDHKLYDLANLYSLEEIYTRGLGERMQIDNQMVRMVSTIKSDLNKMLVSAIENIQKYMFFGFQDQMDIMEQMVRIKLDLPHFTIPGPQTKPIEPGENTNGELETLIRVYNSFDLALYDIAREHYYSKLKEGWL